MHNHGNNHSFTARDMFHWNTNLASLWHFMLACRSSASVRIEVGAQADKCCMTWALTMHPNLITRNTETKSDKMINTHKASRFARVVDAMIQYLGYSQYGPTSEVRKSDTSLRFDTTHILCVWMADPEVKLRFVDSFTVPLCMPNGRHCLPLELCKATVTGVW